MFVTESNGDLVDDPSCSSSARNSFKPHMLFPPVITGSISSLEVLYLEEFVIYPNIRLLSNILSKRKVSKLIAA